MAQIDGKELLADMDSYLSETAPAEAEAETALPFETLDEYLSDPQEFEDVTAKLLKKVSAVFDLAAKYNRHSPEYLKSCAQLEKGIKYLGSACLMKYALVQHKYPQPMLAELNTANLYTMAAVLFNKLDRALTEYMEEKQAVDDALLEIKVPRMIQFDDCLAALIIRGCILSAGGAKLPKRVHFSAFSNSIQPKLL
jgi:hypothetical protein